MSLRHIKKYSRLPSLCQNKRPSNPCDIFRCIRNAYSINSASTNLQKNGYEHFRGLTVPDHLIKPLLTFVNEEFNQQRDSVDYKLLRLSNNIYSSKLRYSIPLSWSDEVDKVLRYICSDQIYGELMEGLVGQDGELVELSALISLPGSEAQSDHTDLSYSEGTARRGNESDWSSNTAGAGSLYVPLLCSTFVALQDVSSDMGPTKIFPRSHTYEFHSQIEKKSYTYSPDGHMELDQDLFYETCDATNIIKNNTSNVGLAGIKEDDFVSMDVSSGSVYMIDSRVVHSGTANTSAKPRVLLCFAFQRQDKELGKARRALGFTYHLSEAVSRQKLTLRRFRDFK
jgi:ectoine hydroxylase-related dioxygenase (phytanoyl-CoA dioxygenase family)